jgi:hypothetical protein
MDEVEKLKKALQEVYDTVQSTSAYEPNDLLTIEYLRQEAQRLENAVAAIGNICEAVYPLFKNAG